MSEKRICSVEGCGNRLGKGNDTGKCGYCRAGCRPGWRPGKGRAEKTEVFPKRERVVRKRWSKAPEPVPPEPEEVPQEDLETTETPSTVEARFLTITEFLGLDPEEVRAGLIREWLTIIKARVQLSDE